jgi:hypothetical protein
MTAFATAVIWEGATKVFPVPALSAAADDS